MAIRLKLRSKLLLVSLVVLLLPWLGARYLQAVEEVLQQQQAQSMATITKAGAVVVNEWQTVLKERSDLLKTDQTKVEVLNAIAPIQLDGYFDDWLPYQSQLHNIRLKNQVNGVQAIDPQDVSARYLMARVDNELTLFLDVVDDSVVFRNPAYPQRHGGDALVIALVDPQQHVRRYLFSSSAYGKLTAYEYIGRYTDPIILTKPTPFKAMWQPSPYGYRVELSLPLAAIDKQFSMAIIDIDKRGEDEKVIGVGDVRDRQLFVSVLLPSLQLTEVLSRMTFDGVRLWLVDSQRHVLATSGSGRIVIEEPEINSFLDFIYHLLLEPPVSDDESLSHEQSLLLSDAVSQALTGKAATERRQSSVGARTILSSHPVMINGDVYGAIIAEQNTNAILGLQNQAVKTLFQTTLVVFVIVVLLLLGFASRLSFRIRRLNNDLTSAVTGDGRLSGEFSQRIEYDELGELRRGFEQLYARLGRYTEYLEALSSRLAHELRTPIAVIRTSLEHLDTDPDKKQVYINRARQGTERLNNIVARMSEASRLEQSINTVSLQRFDLKALFDNLIPVYSDLYVDSIIRFETALDHINIHGSQELMVQMLDKLISNAIDFHQKNTEIVISASHENQHVCITIQNRGKKLPDKLASELFQPMISVRNEKADTHSPHLGLGLYIVKLIVDLHKGEVEAKNWQHGVEIEIKLPIN